MNKIYKEKVPPDLGPCGIDLGSKVGQMKVRNLESHRSEVKACLWDHGQVIQSFSVLTCDMQIIRPTNL